MDFSFELENIKCDSCATYIKNHLKNDKRISDVEVNVANGVVTIHSDEDAGGAWLQALADMGYPKRGLSKGVDAVKARAKSFISCKVGRLEQVIKK